MIRTYRLIRSNWSRNHRHQGGVGAVARCLMGTLALRAGVISLPRTRPATVETVSFSVVPWMTSLWARLLLKVLSQHDVELLIGDSSGGLGESHRQLIGGDRTRVIPCLNNHHGEKIDLFLAKLCRAPYVLIADDDVFWLDDEPLTWAIAQLEADPRVAVVSLRPREGVSSVLRSDGLAMAMGSHCLVVRRELWMRERLSFVVAPAPSGAEDWFYDTGDLANVELLRRGYQIVFATPEIERHLVPFDGVSSWILKLQGRSPDRLAATIRSIPVRWKKALEAIRVARGLSNLAVELRLSPSRPEIVSASRLSAAQDVLEVGMPAADRDAIYRGVDERLGRVRDRLRALERLPDGSP